MTLLRSSDQLQGDLQQREEEIKNVKELKHALEERLASVESDHTHLMEKTRHEKVRIKWIVNTLLILFVLGEL